MCVDGGLHPLWDVCVVELEPFNYDANVYLIATLRHHALHDRLQQAREAMNSRFPLSPELWIQWIEDARAQGHTPEAVDALFCRAVADYPAATDVWLKWVKFALSRGDRAYVNEVFDKALDGIGSHFTAGPGLWKKRRSWIRKHSGLSPDEMHDAIAVLFRRQLTLPLAKFEMKQAYEDYCDFEREKNSSWTVPATVEASYRAARAVCDSVLDFEDRIEVLPAEELLDAWQQYISFSQQKATEKGGLPSRAIHVFERAIVAYPVYAPFWVSYLAFLSKHVGGAPSLSIHERAVRSCPWVGALWTSYILAHERAKSPEHIIERVFQQARQSGIQVGAEFLQLQLTYCAWRRRLVHHAMAEPSSAVSEEENTRLKTALQNALQAGLSDLRTYFPLDDPLCVFARFCANVQARVLKLTAESRGLWKEILSVHKKEPLMWLEAISLERSMGANSECRKLFRQALLACVSDAAECLCSAYLEFEREEGSAADYADAVERVEKATLELRKIKWQQMIAQQEALENAQDQTPDEVSSAKPSSVALTPSKGKKRGRSSTTGAQDSTDQQQQEQQQEQRRHKKRTARTSQSKPKERPAKRAKVVSSSAETAADEHMMDVVPVAAAVDDDDDDIENDFAPPAPRTPATNNTNNKSKIPQQQKEQEQEQTTKHRKKSTKQPKTPKTEAAADLDDDSDDDSDNDAPTTVSGKERDSSDHNNKKRKQREKTTKTKKQKKHQKEEKQKSAPAKERTAKERRPPSDAVVKRQRTESSEPTGDEDQCTLFVANLPFSITEATLLHMFGPYGRTKEIRMIRDRRGSFKGYCYVEYIEPPDEDVLKLDGTRVENFEIQVARSRQTAVAAKRQGQASDPMTVFVTNLPIDCTEELIRSQLFPNAVKEVRLIRDKATNRPRCCYVEFTNENAAMAALMKDKTMLDGKRRVNIQRAQAQQTRTMGQTEPDTVFVYNLSLQTTAEHLTELFRPVGEPKEVRLVTRPDGTSKCFAYVQFSDEKITTDALSLNGESLHGHAIRVERARKNRQPPPSGAKDGEGDDSKYSSGAGPRVPGGRRKTIAVTEQQHETLTTDLVPRMLKPRLPASATTPTVPQQQQQQQTPPPPPFLQGTPPC
eukprot:gnl/Spiro4/25422_TR12682_c0_g1_i1.p1 gnl/Spiro4/25422_TR12682_c0_g1~~gnl/Spiro4/25422_TR12682_c0_g1_i1.p1  ORF type:complete len:1123 (+),score=271.20 gnl/Spiro4/25422_TR12682_c0_g1_i1:30-3371(+)